MKAPILGQTVLYVPLADNRAQAFIVAPNPALGDAVVAPSTTPTEARAAVVVGATDGRTTLLVCKQPGDPFRDRADVFFQQLADVPYSALGAPGTWMHPEDAVPGPDIAAGGEADADVPA